MTEQEISSQTDLDKLTELVNVLLLSDGMKTIFAIAPESSPQHPVVKQFKSMLQSSSEESEFEKSEFESKCEFEFQGFFYSENSLYNFMYGSGQTNQRSVSNSRRIVMAFGIEQLPKARISRELKQLNLGREVLFEQQIILIFWLNKFDFLEEFRNRAPDFWDWRGKVVRFETKPPAHRLFYPYLEWLIAENSYLRISGVMQVQRQVDIFLDQIYVSLQAVRRQEVTETLDGARNRLERTAYGSERLMMSSSSPDGLEEFRDRTLFQSDFELVSTTTKTVTQKVDLSQAVRENKYSVILGAPGAGKTTLLRYLALHFAIAQRDNEETVAGAQGQEDLGKSVLPIFLRIADYAEQLRQEPEINLCDYLCQFHHQLQADFQDETDSEANLAELLLENMQLGRCLILLDGLDEVFDREIRKQIVGKIDAFVDDYSTNKFVITSRIAGYRDVNLSSRFAEFTIEDMGSEQVDNFLHRWCLAVERAQQPEASPEEWERSGYTQAKEISAAIQGNEGVKRLTANPLLLTILALIHRNGDRLPNRRVKLYELAVQTLTEDWQLHKKLPDTSRVLLTQSEVVEFLAPLAYWMHTHKPSGVVPEGEVEQQLAEKLAELNDTEPESDSVRQTVQEFLRKVRETTGLFVERAPGVYGFMHLTFEEYFAARHIADNDTSEILEIIREHIQEPRWNEPILLALGYYGVHFPRQVNKLVERLFRNLDSYKPIGEVKIKNASSPDAVIIWSGLQNQDLRTDNVTNVIATEGSNPNSQSELPLRDLLFAGQVISEVEVNSSIRKKIIDKLVLTYLGLDADFENETIKQVLRLLRQIELFNHKAEVISRLKQAVNDSTFTEGNRIKAQSAILYIACGEPGTVLINCVAEIVELLKPSLFASIKDLVAEFGDEMTPALEASRENYSNEEGSQRALTFMTAMSYVRKNKYDKAIALLEEINQQPDSRIKPFVSWALALCFQEKEEYEQANNYYGQSKIAEFFEENTLFVFWRNWAWCNRLQTKYDESLRYFQKSLAIAKEIENSKREANILYNIARTYQDWGKYESAIAYHQKSYELYKQLEREENAANQWYWLGACYRDWGKYEEALECQQQCLVQRQKLDDQSDVALSYYQLGRIYQDWGKYEQAIANYQQSLKLYEQLAKEINVANQWYNLADCYQEWSKYQQALECQQQCFAIRQKLDDQSLVAVSYYQLGRIYQAWGKYEQAIANYQQSRELYEQLGNEKFVAYRWYDITDCYREWGKYQQALEFQQQCLAIDQKLDDQSLVALSYYQLGRIYQAWGKYDQAIANYQQSHEIYEQLGNEKSVAYHLYDIADCYREWGKYEQALESVQGFLTIRQKLDDQLLVAVSYYQLGRIYQGWGKYDQAVANYQQSRELYEQLDNKKFAANLWGLLANCYRDWGKYKQAIESQQQCLAIRQKLDDQSLIALSYYQLGRIYKDWGKYELAIDYYQKSRDLHQKLGQDERVAIRCRRIANSQRLLAKDTENKAEALDLLTQAEQNIRQAIEINTTGEYKENLAYDYTVLALLCSEHLRLNPSLQEQITHFEEYYNTSFTYFTDLGQVTRKVSQALDIARAYLEVKALENLERSEQIAQESLQVFQEYNRLKLEAAACKLLGEIYLKRAQQNQTGTETTAAQFLNESLQIYRELELEEKASEVENLMEAQ